jgi:hypothetical protein
VVIENQSIGHWMHPLQHYFLLTSALSVVKTMEWTSIGAFRICFNLDSWLNHCPMLALNSLEYLQLKLWIEPPWVHQELDMWD